MMRMYTDITGSAITDCDRLMKSTTHRRHLTLVQAQQRMSCPQHAAGQAIAAAWQESDTDASLCRVGPPRFLGGILVAWGLVASLFAWMQTAAHFYILRFILGLAESGAYPGPALTMCIHTSC